MTQKAMRLFAQIAKIDEARREVTGVATSEVVDKDGEIFDYASSKPYFKAWSAEISKATDGKSLGNVREMHEPSAVGKLTNITFDDDTKEIIVVAKIVDDPAWMKCMEGVYTGFSIGGIYVKTWKDGEAIRFTAKPAEISIVDNPCNPGAHFTAVKADGTWEMRKFGKPQEVAAPAKPAAKAMCDVAQLAYLIDSISCVRDYLENEAIWEGDESPIPERLNEWCREGLGILEALLSEEGSELVGDEKKVAAVFRARMEKAKAAVLAKVGAKHSAATKAHHEAIAKCMDKVAGAVDEANEHLGKLMDKDMEEAIVPQFVKVDGAPGPGQYSVSADTGIYTFNSADIGKTVHIQIQAAPAAKQASAPTGPEIQNGEHQMNEKQQQDLTKAAADSASALSKITELETSMTAINKGMEAIGKAVGDLATAVAKLAGVGDDSQKVARTTVPAITVTKEDDGEGNRQVRKNAGNEGARTGAATVHDSLKEAFKNPLPAEGYLATAARKA